MKRIILPLLVLWAACWPAVSLAQSAPLIIDQNRADRAPPVATAPQTPAPQAAGKAAGSTAAFAPFEMRGLVIKGSSLPRPALDAVGAPYVGRTIAAPDVIRMADELAKVYAASDVALYTVLAPAQDGAQGLAKLVVLEGYIAEVEVIGSENGPPPKLTQAYADRLTAETPLLKPTLERYVALMRDVPGAQVSVQLLQHSKPGAVRMVVKTQSKPLQASVSVNNRGAAFLGRTQVEVALTGNNLLREGDQTRVSLTAPTDWKRFQYLSVSHVEQLGPSGASVNLSAGFLKTNPKIPGFDLKGTATTASVQLSYPAIRSNTKSVFLTAGVDGVDSDNALFGRRISREQTRALRLAAAFVTQSAKQSITASATASQGLDALGARAAGGETDFSKLNVQAAYNRQAGPFIARLAANAQYAATRLPASEQYALGGAQFGRAFSSAVASGDSGYGVSAELAWRPKRVPTFFTGSELYGFADHGEAWTRGRGAMADEMTVSSAGGGVRIGIKGRGVLELELAKPLEAPRRISKDIQLMVNFRSAF